jgi:glycosyltransferase involved in cell wall biosynthesis
MRKRFVMLFLHDTLNRFHLRKDPVLIPLAVSRLGWKSFIVIRRREEKLKVRGVSIISIGNGKLRSDDETPRRNQIDSIVKALALWLELPKVIAIVYKLHPHLVIAYNYFMNPFLSIFLKVATGTSMFVKLDWDGVVRGRTLIGRTLQRLNLVLELIFTDCLIIESTYAKRRIIKEMPFLASKIEVIPNAIDGSLIEDFERAHSLWKDRKEVILSVGRVVRNKGFDILIRAFALIMDQFPRWKVVIVGPRSDDRFFRYLLRLADVLGVRDRVIFTGEVPMKELMSYYNSASIFCLASSGLEGFPISPIEAMAAGLPIVVTTNCCMGDIIKDAGVVVQAEDVCGLAHALGSLISNPQLRLQMGQHARMIASQLTWDKIAERILSLGKD